MSGPTRGLRGTQIFSNLGFGTDYGAGNVVDGTVIDPTAHWYSYTTKQAVLGKVALTVAARSENQADRPMIVVMHGAGLGFADLSVDGSSPVVSTYFNGVVVQAKPSSIYYVAVWGISNGAGIVAFSEEDASLIPVVDAPIIISGRIARTIAARCGTEDATIWFRPNTTDVVWRQYQGEIILPRNMVADILFVATKPGYIISPRTTLTGTLNVI